MMMDDGGESEIPFGQCLISVCLFHGWGGFGMAQEDLNSAGKTWTTQHQVLDIPEGSKQRQWMGKIRMENNN